MQSTLPLTVHIREFTPQRSSSTPRTDTLPSHYFEYFMVNGQFVQPLPQAYLVSRLFQVPPCSLDVRRPPVSSPSLYVKDTDLIGWL